ncbi:hypothetical protein WJX74_006038 [Apatococcus lobatus]|uniref:PTM/DIR17-like Tudor domain-containing protein n=1 Tax=Apatococcus lobatus TaxID=904363 RepID=A0AAW1S2C1_9CHLO
MTEPSGVAYVGRKVLKNFPGHGKFFGTIEKFYGDRKSHPWLVQYEDGDSEDLRLHELLHILQPADTDLDDPSHAQVHTVKLAKKSAAGSKMGTLASKQAGGPSEPGASSSMTTPAAGIPISRAGGVPSRASNPLNPAKRRRVDSLQPSTAPQLSRPRPQLRPSNPHSDSTPSSLPGPITRPPSQIPPPSQNGPNHPQFNRVSGVSGAPSRPLSHLQHPPQTTSSHLQLNRTNGPPRSSNKVQLHLQNGPSKSAEKSPVAPIGPTTSKKPQPQSSPGPPSHSSRPQAKQVPSVVPAAPSAVPVCRSPDAAGTSHLSNRSSSLHPGKKAFSTVPAALPKARRSNPAAAARTSNDQHVRARCAKVNFSPRPAVTHEIIDLALDSDDPLEAAPAKFASHEDGTQSTIPAQYAVNNMPDRQAGPGPRNSTASRTAAGRVTGDKPLATAVHAGMGHGKPADGSSEMSSKQAAGIAANGQKASQDAHGSQQTPCEDGLQPVFPSEPRMLQSRSSKGRPLRKKRKLPKARSRQQGEPGEPFSMLQQSLSSGPKDKPFGLDDHTSKWQAGADEAAKLSESLTVPCGPKDTSSGAVKQADARPMKAAGPPNPSGTSKLPIISHAHPPEPAAERRAKLSKLPSSPCLAPGQALDAPGWRGSQEDINDRPSPVPSCLKAMSVDKAHTIVQGLADDLNARPAKLRLEPAAKASSPGDALSACPASPNPSDVPAHGGSIVSAAAAGQMQEHMVCEPGSGDKHPSECAGSKAVSDAVQHEAVCTSKKAAGQDERLAASKYAIAADAPALAAATAFDKAAQKAIASASFDRSERQSVKLVAGCAVPAGKTASVGVPALDNLSKQAAALVETPASSSNASQQCNADADVISQAGAADCQQEGSSTPSRKRGGRPQGLQGFQRLAAHSQDSWHAMQAAAIGGSLHGNKGPHGLAADLEGPARPEQAAAKEGGHQNLQGSQASVIKKLDSKDSGQAAAAQDRASNHAEQSAARDMAEQNATAATIAVGDSRPTTVAGQASLAAAAVGGQQMQRHPRKHDHRKSRLPQRAHPSSSELSDALPLLKEQVKAWEQIVSEGVAQEAAAAAATLNCTQSSTSSGSLELVKEAPKRGSATTRSASKEAAGGPGKMLGLLLKTAPRRKRSAAVIHEIPVHQDFAVQEAPKRLRQASDGSHPLPLLGSKEGKGGELRCQRCTKRVSSLAASKGCDACHRAAQPPKSPVPQVGSPKVPAAAAAVASPSAVSPQAPTNARLSEQSPKSHVTPPQPVYSPPVARPLPSTPLPTRASMAVKDPTSRFMAHIQAERGMAVAAAFPAPPLASARLQSTATQTARNRQPAQAQEPLQRPHSTPSKRAIQQPNQQPIQASAAPSWVHAAPGSSLPVASWPVASFQGHLVSDSMLRQAPGTPHPVSMTNQGIPGAHFPNSTIVTGFTYQPLPTDPISLASFKESWRVPSQKADSVPGGYPSGGVPSLLPRFMATLPQAAAPLYGAGASPTVHSLQLAAGIAVRPTGLPANLDMQAGNRAGTAPSALPSAPAVQNMSPPPGFSGSNGLAGSARLEAFLRHLLLDFNMQRQCQRMILQRLGPGLQSGGDGVETASSLCRPAGCYRGIPPVPASDPGDSLSAIGILIQHCVLDDREVLCCRDSVGNLLAVGNADREGVVCAQCERTVPLRHFAHTCAGLPRNYPFACQIQADERCPKKSLQVLIDEARAAGHMWASQEPFTNSRVPWLSTPTAGTTSSTPSILPRSSTLTDGAALPARSPIRAQGPEEGSAQESPAATTMHAGMNWEGGPVEGGGPQLQRGSRRGSSSASIMRKGAAAEPIDLT